MALRAGMGKVLRRGGATGATLAGLGAIGAIGAARSMAYEEPREDRKSVV